MKRILALALCLLLCVSMAGFAEEAGAQQTVTSVSGLFTIELPDGYAPLSTELIQAAMDKFGSKELENAQYNIAALQDLDLSSGDYFYNDDFSRNFNIQIAAESGVTPEMLETQADQLGEVLTESYVEFGASEGDCKSLGLETIGENLFFNYQVTLLNQEIQQYITVDSNGNMYTLSFTNMDEAAARAVLESFQLIEG